MSQTAKSKQWPYAVHLSGNLFVLRDSRNGQLASYPTTRGKARAEAKFMNEQYAAAVAEEAAIAKAESR